MSSSRSIRTNSSRSSRRSFRADWPGAAHLNLSSSPTMIHLGFWSMRLDGSLHVAFGLRLHDVIADRVAHEIADRAEMQLSHEVRAVRLDRFHADPECRRRLLVALPFSDQLNDLALAGRHAAWREIVLRAVATPETLPD